jgi:hypothetical protein
MGFIVTEVQAEFLGKRIAAVYDSFRGSKLYIDGEVVDTADKAAFPTKSIALLRGRIVGEDNKTHVVEVYRKGFFYAKMKICINGKRVAGYGA